MTVLGAVEIESCEDPWETVPVIGGTLVDARAECAGEAPTARCRTGVSAADTEQSPLARGLVPGEFEGARHGGAGLHGLDPPALPVHRTGGALARDAIRQIPPVAAFVPVDHGLQHALTAATVEQLSLIHISEPTRHFKRSRMPSSA